MAALDSATGAMFQRQPSGLCESFSKPVRNPGVWVRVRHCDGSPYLLRQLLAVLLGSA